MTIEKLKLLLSFLVELKKHQNTTIKRHARGLYLALIELLYR